ncbi:hypothetical protein [Chitinimonas lacunae]|uniref:Uncharacterized protein n=1 Tax=Chitinimonas lacunae TaxID=1963018 RepID=A0ABV8MJ28_9NEIS
MVAMLLGLLVAMIFHALTLHRTMDAVSEINRPCPGALVWLTFFPLLGALWYLAYIILLSTAIQKDMALRGVQDNGQLPLAIALVVCWVLSLVPFINAVSWMALLVIWIIYWVKMAEYRRRLAG